MPTEPDYNPRFDQESLYLVTGATLQKIYDLIRRNRLIKGAGVTLNESADGVSISVTSSMDGLTVQTLDACQNGIPGTRDVRSGPFIRNDDDDE